MNNQFKQHYLGEYVIDQEFEVYVSCWMAYHRAADAIDGHILGSPRTSEVAALVNKASLVGSLMMHRAKLDNGLTIINKNKWQQAKMEALRRLEKL